jgi:cell division protein ZipA
MDGLRWLLLLFGLLVIAGVYLLSRRERGKAKNEESPSDRREPSLLAGSAASQADAEDDGLAPDGDVDNAAAEQKIVTLRVVARDKGAFAGDELVLILRGIGMRHGQFGIFHRHEDMDDSDVVFSVASLVEPGSFDLENIKEQKIPGISVFMVLPGPIDAAEAFDLMMAAARTLSQSLNAELLDESGSTLSIQRERYLREEIIQYQHGIMVA